MLSRAGRDECGSRGVLAIRAFSALETRYGRSKFAMRCVDFCAPYKIGGNDREMTPYGAVLSRAGRGERDSCGVLR